MCWAGAYPIRVRSVLAYFGFDRSASRKDADAAINQLDVPRYGLADCKQIVHVAVHRGPQKTG
jgi:hypothetical protein